MGSLPVRPVSTRVDPCELGACDLAGLFLFLVMGEEIGFQPIVDRIKAIIQASELARLDTRQRVSGEERGGNSRVDIRDDRLG